MRLQGHSTPTEVGGGRERGHLVAAALRRPQRGTTLAASDDVFGWMAGPLSAADAVVVAHSRSETDAYTSYGLA